MTIQTVQNKSQIIPTLWYIACTMSNPRQRAAKVNAHDLALQMREERAKDFGDWLRTQLQTHKKIKNASDLERLAQTVLPVEMRYKRQYWDQLISARTGTGKKHTIPSIETVIAAAYLFDSPVNEALEAAGYRRQGGATDRLGEQLLSFWQELDLHNKTLTLRLVQVIYDTARTIVADDPGEAELVAFYRVADAQQRNLFHTLMSFARGGASTTPKQLNPSPTLAALETARSSNDVAAIVQSLPDHVRVELEHAIKVAKEQGHDAEESSGTPRKRSRNNTERLE